MNIPLHPHLATRRRYSASRQQQIGLSLVELMISIAIGLLLLAGMAMLFAQQYSARSELEKSAQQVENGRYAMEILRDDIRQAGYYGEYYPDPATVTVTYTTPEPCATAVANLGWVWSATAPSVPVAIQGNAGVCVPADRRTGTPILVVRRADTAITPYASADPNVVYVQSTPTQFVVDRGNVSDPATNPFTLTKKDGTPADVRRLLVHIYYIGTSNGLPALKLLELSGAGFSNTVLVDGIENMHFDFGVDNVAPMDGSPDAYTTAPANWADVMTVRVSLLARNNEATPGYVDDKTYVLGSLTISATGMSAADRAFKRHVYSEVVRAVNPSGRRE